MDSDNYDSDDWEEDSFQVDDNHNKGIDVHQITTHLPNTQKIVKIRRKSTETPTEEKYLKTIYPKELILLHAQRVYENNSCSKADQYNTFADQAIHRLKIYRKHEKYKQLKKKKIETDKQVEEKKVMDECRKERRKYVHLETPQNLYKKAIKRNVDLKTANQQEMSEEKNKRWYKKQSKREQTYNASRNVNAYLLQKKLQKKIHENNAHLVEESIKEETKQVLDSAKKIVEKFSYRYVNGSYILTSKTFRDLSQRCINKKEVVWKPGPYYNNIECMDTQHFPRRLFSAQYNV